MFPGHFINHQQPEIADKTSNTYVTLTITERIEISIENMCFTTYGDSRKCRQVIETTKDDRKLQDRHKCSCNSISALFLWIS